MSDLPRTVPKKKKSLSLTLPIPPSVNQIYYNTRGGGRRLNKKAQKYIADSRALANEEISKSDWVIAQKGEWTHLDMVFYMPDKRRRDASNCLKILLDALEGIIYEDDMYALPRIQSVELDRDNPRLEMVLSNQTKTQRTKCIKEICYE